MQVRSPIQIGGIIAFEFAAVALALLAVTTSIAGRVALAGAGAAIGAATAGWLWRARHARIRRSMNVDRPATADAAAAQSAAVDAVGDALGIVAVLALGGTALITSAGTALPGPVAGSSDPDRPAVRIQLVIAADPGGSTAYLAIRVGGDGIAWAAGTLRATLESAVRRTGRRLAAESIAHHRLTGADLRMVTTPTPGRTLRVALRAGGMTETALVRATASTGAASWLTWHGGDLLVRVADHDPGAVATASTLLDEIGTVTTARRADIRLTTPLAWPRIDPVTLPRYGTALRPPSGHGDTDRDGAALRPRSNGEDGGRPLVLPADGVPLGFDRNGEAVFLRVVARPGPVRVVVAGGGPAARTIAAGARDRGVRVAVAAGGVSAAGEATPAVPLLLQILEHPAATDSAALRAADLVVCQPLPAQEAEVVAQALSLSTRIATWLAHAEDPMVALIGDGAVRWAMSGTDRGLAGARRT